MYDYGVLLCYKVIFLLQKGIFLCWLFFVSFLPFAFFPRGSRTPHGCQGMVRNGCVHGHLIPCALGEGG